MFRLDCVAQSYDWGKAGRDSKVAELLLAAPPAAADRRDAVAAAAAAAKPFAELWMGTHVSGASELHGSSSSGGAQLLLSELLRGAPALAGAGGGGAGPVTSAAATAGELPFLFKVLSIRKALSIQAHPDKALAARLHAERPGVYKDGNHKPEMALALTPFEALIGFRPLREIHAHLTRFPELAAVVGSETTQKLADAAGSAGDNTPAGRAALQALFGALMGADEAAMRAQLATLVGRLRAQASSPVGTLEELVVRLDSQFPADVGTFCALLLNYVKMEPGQAVFLAANEPHAYLSGDCVECMATSDNVVRSGLTPKYKDVATLVSMLTYRSGTASSQLLSGEPFGAAPHTTLYDPPIDEFAVLRTALPAGAREAQRAVHGPSIALVTGGGGRFAVLGGDVAVQSAAAAAGVQAARAGDAGLGCVFFVPAGVEVEFEAGPSGLTVFRAYCEA